MAYTKQKGVYICDQYNFKSTCKSNLTRHKKSIHKDVKYPCNHCDYKATRKDALIAHTKSIHEGIT